MDCPHCKKELTAVYRGLVVLQFTAHPVVDGDVDLETEAEGHDGYAEEYEGGSHGVFHACPHCRTDVTHLFSDGGNAPSDGE